MKRFQLLPVLIVLPVLIMLFAAVASAQPPANPHSWWDGDDPSNTRSKPAASNFTSPWVNKGIGGAPDATGFGDYVPNAAGFNGKAAWSLGDDTGNPTTSWTANSTSAFNFLHNGSDSTAVIVGITDDLHSTALRAISNNGGSGSVGVHYTASINDATGCGSGCAHVWMTRGVGGSPAIQGDNLVPK